ncbi:MAG TPA: hypothetical protein VMM60_02235 [Ilumatobacter sp.]|nr:hypothetical protein [Ilumatobacter sp.]
MKQPVRCRRRGIAAVAAIAFSAPFVLSACDGGAVDQEVAEDGPVEPAPEPLVADIGAAIAAVEAWYGGPQEFFEVSATLQQVSVIVAVDDGEVAEQAFFVGGELVEPAPIVDAAPAGATFTASEVSFDPETIFDGIAEELEHPVLIDFAITGAPNGVIYDATVASDEGGVLLVLLGPDGEVEAVQAS